MKYETEVYISIPLLTKEQEELHFCCHVQFFAAQRSPISYMVDRPNTFITLPDNQSRLECFFRLAIVY